MRGAIVVTIHTILSLRLSLVPMTMLIEITRHVPRMIVVLSGNFLFGRLVAVAMLIQISRLVARMLVVLSWLFLRHIVPPVEWILTYRRVSCSHYLAAGSSPVPKLHRVSPWSFQKLCSTPALDSLSFHG